MFKQIFDLAQSVTGSLLYSHFKGNKGHLPLKMWPGPSIAAPPRPHRCSTNTKTGWCFAMKQNQGLEKQREEEKNRNI